MAYIIENISNETIKIGGFNLKPNTNFTTNDVSSFMELYNKGKVKINKVNSDNNKTVSIQNSSEKTEVNELKRNANIRNLFNDKIHDTLMSSVFKLYTGGDMNTEEIEIMKNYFKSFYQIKDKEKIYLIDKVSNRNEMVEVLLNHIYPYVFSQWLVDLNK